MNWTNESFVNEPIIMFGGSPMRVAVPPKLDAIACVIKKGTGLMRNSAQARRVIGLIKSTVVAFGKNEEMTAVTTTKSKSSFKGSPPTSLVLFIAMY